jgi:heat shock protein HslJ
MSSYTRTTRNKVSFNALLIACILALFACGSQASKQSITDAQWQWTAMDETEPSSISLVSDPTNYTLMLKSDGSFDLKADCNMVLGTYILEGNSISFKMGPSQMAYCGDASLDVQFLDFLGRVESYSLDTGKLILNLMNDSGKMTFEITSK